MHFIFIKNIFSHIYVCVREREREKIFFIKIKCIFYNFNYFLSRIFI
jgi:hypothetical protein